MAMAAGPKKSVSIYDYPEHLNPFHEEDNHNKIRFWTLGRKSNRSNSINFSGIKDLKNSWAFRSFMRKGKKGQQENKDSQVNGDPSPIMYRRALQYSQGSANPSRTTIGSPERPDRYVYGGSITPLPRSRFQERLRSHSNYDVEYVGGVTPRMARSEITGSRLSVESTNPFEDGPVPPVRMNRRKKKRAPPPPHAADVSISSVDSEIKSGVTEIDVKKEEPKPEEEDLTLNIKLEIIEDEERKRKSTEVTNVEKATSPKSEYEGNEKQIDAPSPEPDTSQKPDEIKLEKEPLEIAKAIDSDKSTKKSDLDDDILPKVPFPKVNIVRYRRNSSVNEDDIQLRKGNSDDPAVSYKRSKSLNNDLNLNYVTFDINLNEGTKKAEEKDANGNDKPKKIICKLYDETSRKHSLDNSISSTEKEFIEIDKATRELEREISKLNSALKEDDDENFVGARLSVSDMRRRFDNNNTSTPNPIPKPKRSQHGSISPINGHYSP